MRTAAVCLIFAVAGCNNPPECERGPGLANALSRSRDDSAALVKAASELALATESAETKQGQVVHERASRLADLLADGADTNSLQVAGLIQATILAGENLATACDR